MHTAIDWSFKEIKKLLPKDADALLAFKYPPEMQERIAELLEQNSDGTLNEEEARELKQIRKIELKILGLKAHALEQKSRDKR